MSMTEKILFWMDSNLLYFGITKYFQEKYDAKYFAITDFSEQLEKSFCKQNIIKFDKIWNYRENVFLKNKKPDFEYLEKFEKLTKIGLWKLAYSERIFYNYNKYHQFSEQEILGILEQECRFFERVLDEVKPKFLVIKMVDYHHSQLLCEICKSRGIRILTLSPTRFGDRYMITEEAGLLDPLEEIKLDVTKFKNFEELREMIKKYSNQQLNHGKKFKSSKLVQFRASLIFFLKVCNRNYRKHIFHTGRTRLNVFKNELKLLIDRNSRYNFLNKISISNLPTNEKFIYFTLHSEPERALLFPAPFYMNQLSVIQNVSKSIPAGYKLYVKEHPTQRIFGWRNKNWYKELTKLPNVKIIHPNVSNEKLLKKCSLVISIGGTVGLEGSFFNKPSIVFADVIYSMIKSFTKIQNLSELPKIIRSSLRIQVDINDLNKYIQTIESISFQINLEKIRNDMKHRFYYDDFLREVEISEIQIKKFIEDYEDDFKKIVDEHIKKIRKYKYAEKF